MFIPSKSNIKSIVWHKPVTLWIKITAVTLPYASYTVKIGFLQSPALGVDLLFPSFLKLMVTCSDQQNNVLSTLLLPTWHLEQIIGSTSDVSCHLTRTSIFHGKDALSSSYWYTVLLFHEIEVGNFMEWMLLTLLSVPSQLSYSLWSFCWAPQV